MKSAGECLREMLPFGPPASDITALPFPEEHSSWDCPVNWFKLVSDVFFDRSSWSYLICSWPKLVSRWTKLVLAGRLSWWTH